MNTNAIRSFLLFLILLVLVACQSQLETLDPVESVVPSPQVFETPPSPAPVPHTPTPVQPAQGVETATAVPPTVTITNEPMPDPTQEPSVSYPAEPAPPMADDAYPAEPTPVEVGNPEPDTVTDFGVVPVWTYQVVNEYPHDSTAYTQGLVIEEDGRMLLEGTGRQSTLRRVNLETGEVQQFISLPDQYFGEGITLFEDKIFQLTWKSQVGFIYDAEGLSLLGEFYYPHEGWGITHDGSHLIISDGTDVIRYLDPETFQEVRRIQVMSDLGSVTLLNELEYVEGEIWANIWYQDLIVRISPSDGNVLGWINLAGLLPPQLRSEPEAVLNGIAYDSGSERVFVTGKLWPALYEIEIIDPMSG
jgi:glutamine cyclotransferase